MKNIFRNKKIFILGAVLIAGAIYLVFSNKNSPQSAQASNNINEYPSVSNNTYILTPSKENSDNNVYSDLQYNFSFEYPKDFTATKFQEAAIGPAVIL